MRPIFKQYVIVTIANFAMLHIGLNMAWLSPIMVILRDANQTVLPEPITEVEMSWVLSCSSITDMLAIIFTGYLANNLGRKYSIILASGLRIIMCLLFIFTSRVWMLILGKVICGLSDGFLITVVSTYNTEIASKEIRGGLGTLSQIWSAFGGMLMLCIGPYVSYNTNNIILTSIIVVTIIPLFFIPESPYILYSQGKTDDAIKVLKYLRDEETTTYDEIKEYSMANDNINLKEILKDKVVLKTIVKVAIFATLGQLTGATAVNFHLQTIYKLTNTSVSPEISSVITGFVSLFACFCTIFLTDKFGRKPVLIISLIGVGIGMVALGIFFKHTEDYVKLTGFWNYLPIISIVLVMYSFNAGLGSLMWIVFAELFEGPFRAFGVSSGLCVAAVFAFLTLRYFNTLTHVLGPAICYWIFAVCCGLLLLFILFFIPETKGKTFRQIQKDLGKYKIEKS